MQCDKRVAQLHRRLTSALPFLFIRERNSISEAEKSIENTEDDHLLVHELVNTSFPVDQQSREHTQVGICHTTCVRYRHLATTS